MGELIPRRTILLGLAATALPAALPMGTRGVVQGVADKFSPADPGAVRLGGLLGERCRKNASVRLQGKEEEELLGGFRNRPGKQAWVGEHVGKWLHAATLAWAYTKEPELRAKLDRVAASLLATQQADGYLGTYADGAHWNMGKNESWDVWVHKYDLLGLLTYYAHTGNSAALDASRKIADLLIRTFGREGQLNLNERSTHVGLASGSVLEPMVLLHRATGEEKYLDFARFIVDRWEEEKGPKLLSALSSDLRSVKKTANAKAYEMLSCLVGLCELYRATGEAKYLIPAGNGWSDVLANQLLITGSGSSREHWTDEKRFLSDAKSDIAETCVTVTWLQLTQQLLRLTGEARYADELEKTVYNHLAAAQRPDGAAWAYFTALDGKKPYKTEQNCCTSSGPRGWAMLPTLAYMTSEDGIVVNFFAPGTAMLRVDGETVAIRQETTYPREGRVTLAITVPKPMKFALRIRVPSWSSLQGIKAESGKYWTLRQTWSRTQIVTLDFALPIRLLDGEGSNAGRVAIARGPQILAIDQLYNPGLEPVTAAAPAMPSPRLKVSAEYRDPDGLPVWETDGVLLQETEKFKAGEPVTLRLVPFGAAGAHGHEYSVWLPRPQGAAPAKSA